MIFEHIREAYFFMSGRKEKELDGITLLGNQGTKYSFEYASTHFRII